MPKRFAVSFADHKILSSADIVMAAFSFFMQIVLNQSVKVVALSNSLKA
jgi:hypothetical protein